MGALGGLFLFGGFILMLGGVGTIDTNPTDYGLLMGVLVTMIGVFTMSAGVIVLGVYDHERN